MVIKPWLVSPLRIGLWDPFQMAFSWFVNRETDLWWKLQDLWRKLQDLWWKLQDLTKISFKVVGSTNHLLATDFNTKV